MKKVTFIKTSPTNYSPWMKLFMESNKLTIVNSLPICSGTTTWTRTKLGIKLSSTIDLFVVCEKVLPFVTEINIDIKEKQKITNFTSGKNATESGHICG